MVNRLRIYSNALHKHQYFLVKDFQKMYVFEYKTLLML